MLELEAIQSEGTVSLGPCLKQDKILQLTLTKGTAKPRHGHVILILLNPCPTLSAHTGC